MSHLQRLARGPRNELHKAALDGSSQRTESLLAGGRIDIDQGDPRGWTPLMFAAEEGHSNVIKVLLNRGASLLPVDDDDYTALLVSAQHGQLGVTNLLLEAGAQHDALNCQGFTPLHVAAIGGHSGVMEALVGAGANANSRAPNGQTALHIAALEGHVDAARVLLRAGANPLLPTRMSSGNTFVPLDGAALNGHLAVARELVQRFGIRGCAGASAGVDALGQAAVDQHLDVMALLCDAGVVDTGNALVATVFLGRERALKFLLEQKGEGTARTTYASTPRDGRGHTPLLSAVTTGPCSPRVVRLLVDAGADATLAVRVPDGFGRSTKYTPLDCATRCLAEKVVDEDFATAQQLRNLRASRRLLLQVEVVHATSWLWGGHAGCPAAPGKKRAQTESTNGKPLKSRLPIMWRRSARRGAALPGVFRLAKKA
ncbi:EsV-1-199 [Ectocarpus siliculosus]|uniref:EsV-1-199 n=1 Tax=Ectocarpus siliculosus TaxID=2880 RepID=D8LL76_ECTSI|nr:EsV-1-199 [Ectocarpus siliculosus]|eukprot:CBN76136.1 EsV-1-199 [Ectocarpus siliculosus]